jgi:SAM-dependent methyltransferase
MPSQDDAFRQRVLDNWTDPQTIAAWRRWHGRIASQQQAVSNALIAAARIKPGQRVLDLASGSGEPAIQIAGIVGRDGHVVASDLSRGMLDVASEIARAAGRGNMSFETADAESLPFDDASFDAVTSRMGVMFVIDIQRGLSEIRRVLRPGGCIAFAVWGPFEQSTMFWSMLEPFARRVSPPEPPPGAPGPMRFAVDGSLSEELRAAGFHDVHEETRVHPAPWHGKPDEQWEAFDELVSPPWFDELDSREKQDAIDEAKARLRALYRDGKVQTSACVVIASATR